MSHDSVCWYAGKCTHSKMTEGSCCISAYKRLLATSMFHICFLHSGYRFHYRLPPSSATSGVVIILYLLLLHLQGWCRLRRPYWHQFLLMLQIHSFGHSIDQISYKIESSNVSDTFLGLSTLGRIALGSQSSNPGQEIILSHISCFHVELSSAN